MKKPTAKEAYDNSGLDVRSMMALEKAIKALPAPYSNSGRTAMEAFVQWNLMALVQVNNSIADYMGFRASINPQAFDFRSFDAEESERIEEQALACQDAYAEAIQAHEPFTDLLGPLFAVLVGEGEENACQHFTPWNMAMGAVRLLPTKPGPYIMGEPTCGAGTTLLAPLQHRFKTLGAKDCEHAIIIAGDRDPLCAAMTALQLMANQCGFLMPIGEVSISVEDAIRRDGIVAFHSIMNGRMPVAFEEEDSEEEAHT